MSWHSHHSMCRKQIICTGAVTVEQMSVCMSVAALSTWGIYLHLTFMSFAGKKKVHAKKSLCGFLWVMYKEIKKDRERKLWEMFCCAISVKSSWTYISIWRKAGINCQWSFLWVMSNQYLICLIIYTCQKYFLYLESKRALVNISKKVCSHYEKRSRN